MQKFLLSFSETTRSAEFTRDEVLQGILSEIVEVYEKKHHRGEEDADGHMSKMSHGWSSTPKKFINFSQFQDLLNMVNDSIKNYSGNEPFQSI